MVLKHKAQFNYKLNSHYLLGGVWLANTGMGWHFSCLHSEKAAAHQGRLLLLELEELEAGWVCARAQGCRWVLLVLPLAHIPWGSGAQLLLLRRESYSIKIREQMLVRLGHGVFLLFTASQRDLHNQ